MALVDVEQAVGQEQSQCGGLVVLGRLVAVQKHLWHATALQSGGLRQNVSVGEAVLIVALTVVGLPVQLMAGKGHQRQGHAVGGMQDEEGAVLDKFSFGVEHGGGAFDQLTHLQNGVMMAIAVKGVFDDWPHHLVFVHRVKGIVKVDSREAVPHKFTEFG